MHGPRTHYIHFTTRSSCRSAWARVKLAQFILDMYFRLPSPRARAHRRPTTKTTTTQRSAAKRRSKVKSSSCVVPPLRHAATRLTDHTPHATRPIVRARRELHALSEPNRNHIEKSFAHSRTRHYGNFARLVLALTDPPARHMVNVILVARRNVKPFLWAATAPTSTCARTRETQLNCVYIKAGVRSDNGAVC